MGTPPRAKTIIRNEHDVPPSTIAPFRSVDDLLEAGCQILYARRAHKDALEENEAGTAAAAERDKAWTRYWHKALALNVDKVPVAKRMVHARLNRIEREIVLVLLLGQLALLPEKATLVEEVLARLHLTPKQVLGALRGLSEGSRLFVKGLLGFEDEEEPLPQRRLVIDPSLVEMAIQGGKGECNGWPVKTEEELYGHLGRLSGALQKKADKLDDMRRGYGSAGDTFKWQRRVDSLMKGLDATLKAHPHWALSRLHGQLFQQITEHRNGSWTVFLALLGKELGHISPDDTLFRGSGLARAASRASRSPRHTLSLLESHSQLRSCGWVQPCGGGDTFLTDSVHDIEECEFELTQQATSYLELKLRLGGRKRNNASLVSPRVSLGDLVLSEAVQQALQMAIEQSRNHKVLFGDWGLGDRIAYGRGVAILFYGPPGTGKTAAAEALARTLQKPLLVADYSKIQNCFVGQTEKNISRVFQDACENDAVLFWDEADAMFFDRDSASRNWEVRDVNVLLQELERFEGICILASNRMRCLDKALERRLSLRVEFTRPGKDARREIFARMLPQQLPLAPGVDFERLSNEDLSGGEIKNVILNAARRALVRGGSMAMVRMEDFETAIMDAREGKLDSAHIRRIGFCIPTDGK